MEAELFSFYRVPKMLIKDKRFKKLSSDAKLLYGLMLDRMALSMKNGWLDNENRVYIHYTMESIMEDLQYVMDCMRNTRTRTTNIKAYMVTALYNAPNTMNHYYKQKVQHDWL